MSLSSFIIRMRSYSFIAEKEPKIRYVWDGFSKFVIFKVKLFHDSKKYGDLHDFMWLVIVWTLFKTNKLLVFILFLGTRLGNMRGHENYHFFVPYTTQTLAVNRCITIHTALLMFNHYVYYLSHEWFWSKP